MAGRQPFPGNGIAQSEKTGLTADVPVSDPRVVVVDDDPGIQLLLSETLSGAGFIVATADSGAEAIDVCSEFDPDLVLLDINMPVMDGIEACAAIRNHSTRDFPIIMVTSVDDAVSIQRAFDAGANDFILKPINWPLFQRRLDSVLAEWQKNRELDENTQRVRVLVKVAPEQVMLVSKSGLIIEDLKHRSESDLVDEEPSMQTLDDVFGADISQRFKQRISVALKSRRHTSMEFTAISFGEEQHYEAQFMVDGRERVIIVVQNIDVNKGEQNELYDLAFHDAITNLPNKNLFERFANDALADAGLHSRSLILVALHFDNVSSEVLNDRTGMRNAVGRLQDCLGACGSALNIGKVDSLSPLAQVDSNQFVFALHGSDRGTDIRSLCEQIAAVFSKPIESELGLILFGPRMGTATYPADGGDLATLIHAAEAAANEAHETGSPYCMSSEAAVAQSIGIQDYERELRQAIDEEQLELYFQPRVSMPEGDVTGVEALIRWEHPMRGFVGVSELLELAKATGLIVPIGNWVLRAACTSARAWSCENPPKVSVNLSIQEFGRQDLAERVIETLDGSGLAPDRIDLELTEATLLRSKNSLEELQRLKSLGIGLVLDDFGTGHTSLAHLGRFPIDALKIDESFVKELPDNEVSAAICEVIITMAHKLGMKAIAEGVETRQQLEFLQDRGCDEFQGFHICKPLPANEVDAYLRQANKIDS
ncbi:MAG: putative bifunctional diguanylate cyclase/phosphodiesterase [Woeseiaceae bacterium]